MQLFLLGAGRPASGHKPAALKQITSKTKAMDWQIHSFESLVILEDIYFLGGYHVEEVSKNYPFLNLTVIPDWEERSVLHTFLKAPILQETLVSSYSDTLFRKGLIDEFNEVEADVVFAIDSEWKTRYEYRCEADKEQAETLIIEGQLVEFTGLIKFNSRATEILKKISEREVGTSLIDLINFFQNKKLKVESFDVCGDWAEFNDVSDIARFIFGTKADTLSRLEPIVRHSHIGKQVSFTTQQWFTEREDVLAKIVTSFSNKKLVIRSSSKGEDNWDSSNAGAFESILNIDASDQMSLITAVEKVIQSYGKGSLKDQVLVQEFISSVRSSGVVFTCGLESGSPYYRFNFDDKTQSTESVTSGLGKDLRTVIVSKFDKHALNAVAPKMLSVLTAVEELEQLLGYDKLDIEFAVDESDLVHIFQVRPVTVNHNGLEIDPLTIQKSLNSALTAFKNQQSSNFLYGDSVIFANMPDWNPAEIIGTRPKNLAFSLYQHVITNDVWAKQRAEYGYKYVGSTPLVLSFCGQPYVDVKASFNSFIPETLTPALSHKLINAYIKILNEQPHLHDKIEFEIAFTVWTPDFRKKAITRLSAYGITLDEITEIETGLKKITNKALVRLSDDIFSLDKLTERRKLISSSSLTDIDKAYTLLEDCKSFGTLAFAHAARAGFVSTSLLKSLVETSVMTEERYLLFLKSFSTVTGEFEQDKKLFKFGELKLEELIAKYGHLRPGTYEISTEAYWENPAHYIVTSDETKKEVDVIFEFSSTEKESIQMLLHDISSSLNINQCIDYLSQAIQAREFVKFEFTKNLSMAMDSLLKFGELSSIPRDELSFMEYDDIRKMKLNHLNVDELKCAIEKRKELYSVTCSIELPPIIQNQSDFYCFERLSLQPNFVTMARVQAKIEVLDNNTAQSLTGKIILIQQADPGYDWLFGHDIAGLITLYGGANSHMAIRAAELDLPAAIGVGGKLYEKICQMRQVELDCANQTFRAM